MSEIPRSRYNLVYCDSSECRAALAVDKKYLTVQEERFTNDLMATAVVNFGKTKLVISSIYLREYENGLRRDLNVDLPKIQEMIDWYRNNGNLDIAILTDCNSRSKTCGDRVDNERGDVLCDFIDSNGLKVCNELGQGPTYMKLVMNRWYNSNIDLTITNKQADERIENWRLIKDKINTQHIPIAFDLNMNDETVKGRTRNTRIYDTQRTNKLMLISVFKLNKPILPTNSTEIEQQELEKLTVNLLKAVDRALEKSTPKIKNNENDQPWYSSKCKQLKVQIEKVLKKRRRNRNSLWYDAIQNELNNLNQEYKEELGNAKDEFYGKLNRVDSVNGLWKVLKKAKTINTDTIKNYKLKNGELSNDATEINDDIFDTFVPKAAEDSCRVKALDVLRDNTISNTNKEELIGVIRNMANRKAPGHDKITNDIIKTLIKEEIDYFINYYNLLIGNRYFPKILKKGTLILFQKPEKKIERAKNLRPITLLPGFGKILERLFIERIRTELERRNFFDSEQHGFTAGKSTSSAANKVVNEIKQLKRRYNYVMAVAVDISGAFDNVDWYHMVKNALKAGVQNDCIELLRQLLIDREVVFEAQDCTRTRFTSKGCPQGGTASPTLWLIAMNDLLEKLNELDLKKTAYADDLVMLIYGNRKGEIETTIRNAMRLIENWCDSTILELSADKTQLIEFGRKKLDKEVIIGGKEMTPDDELKYLGVIISNDLKWTKHIKYLSKKTEKVIIVFKYMIYISKGMKIKYKKMIYKQVFLSTIGYCSNVFFKDLYVYQKAMIDRLQRRVLLTLLGGYRTTRNRDLMNYIGVTKLSKELSLRTDVQNEEMSKEEMITAIECELEAQGYSEQLKIIEETSRKEVIWFLSGDGPFRSYLNRMRIESVSQCRLCGYEEETHQHLLNSCIFSSELDQQEELSILKVEELTKRICIELYKVR